MKCFAPYSFLRIPWARHPCPKCSRPFFSHRCRSSPYLLQIRAYDDHCNKDRKECHQRRLCDCTVLLRSCERWPRRPTVNRINRRQEQRGLGCWASWPAAVIHRLVKFGLLSYDTVALAGGERRTGHNSRFRPLPRSGTRRRVFT
jgi:hypothetical protein